MEFVYDGNGVCGVKFNGKNYLVHKSPQKDTKVLLDTAGREVVKYTYDAWGNCKTTVLDETCAEIAELYPFRYRGYYYDSETNLYYLNTRYYDPEVGRFISQDDVSYLDTEHVNGLNLFAYCGNNPVMNVDPSGRFFFTLFSILFATAIAATVSGVVGGITEYANGGSFWNGFVGGAISGTVGSIGIALGLAFGGVIGLAFAGLAGLGGGILGNYIQQGMSRGFNGVDKGEMFFSGFISAVLNVISFGITSCIANGVGAVVGNNLLQKFVSALKFNGYTSIIAGVVFGFPLSLLGIAPTAIWNYFKKGA